MNGGARFDWSLSRKITLLLAALGILLIAVTVVAFQQLRRVDGTYARMFEEEAQALLTIPRMNVVLLDTARVTAQRLAAGTADEAARPEAELAGMTARMVRETTHLRGGRCRSTAGRRRTSTRRSGRWCRLRDGCGRRWWRGNRSGPGVCLHAVRGRN